MERTKRERRTARAFDDSWPPLEKLYLTSSRECDRSVTLTRMCRCNGASPRVGGRVRTRGAERCRVQWGPRGFSPLFALCRSRGLWSLEPEGGSPSPGKGNRPTREPRGGGGVGEAGRGAFALPTPHVRLATCEQDVCVLARFHPAVLSNGAKTTPATGSGARALHRAWPYTSCGG